MCYIAAADADRASEALHQCPSDEAATQYLYFLLGVNQGMFPAKDFRRYPRSQRPSLQDERI